MGYHYRFNIRIRLDSIPDSLRIGCLTPVEIEGNDISTERGGDISPAVTEDADRYRQYLITGGQHIDYSRLKAARTGSGEEIKVILRLVYQLKFIRDLVEHFLELRPAMVNHRPAHCLEDFRRTGGRTRNA